MTTSARYTVITLFAAALLGCSKSTSSSLAPAASGRPTVAEIAVSYTNYHRVTGSEVFVNPTLAMYCRGASQEEVEAARFLHGPHANTAVLIYMNTLAADVFAKKAASFPVGAVIVKRKTPIC